MSKSGSAPGPRPPASEPPELPDHAPAGSSRLYLVRHGESTWNRLHRIQGQMDPPLSSLGREQADRLAQRLAGLDWVGFYCSDLKRARATVAPLARRLGVKPVPMPGLREVALGAWEGLTSTELMERYPSEWQLWRRRPNWNVVPGSEGAAIFEKRVRVTLQQIMDRHPTGDVLAVTHGGVIQVALGQLLRRTSDGLFPFRIGNCSISIVERGSSGRVVITAVNDTCHLS